MAIFPELIIFDCDGVLVDSEALAARIVSQTLADYNIVLNQQEVANQFAGYTDEAIRDHFNKISDAKLPEDFAQIVECATIDQMAGELERLPFIKETLSTLEYPFCVASNSRTDRLDSALVKTGLGDFFPKERRFSSSMVKHPKPAPDLHLMACEMMKVKPEQALIIEDTVAGATGGKNAGIAVLGFVGAEHIVDKKGQGQKLIEAGAYAVFDDMRQLSMMLKDYVAA
ncbi:HAD family hydrolase [Kiloniella majae]|uniref:HAD family hydrolase n=1 Tax=Kiloniella majae TaxID=1938558 RepID=UPI000A2787A5|nr:HAD-IA family hydrolase [Kiloniella majae]